MSLPVPTVRVAGGVVAVPRSLLSDEEIEADELALSCPNPARVKADRRGDVRAHVIPPRLSSLVVVGGEVLYPIAAASVYRRRLFGKTCARVDERPEHEARPLAYRGELLTYQSRAVAALACKPCGVVVAPCGSGKGEVLVALAGAIGLPTLVLVGQTDHVVDLAERIERRLGVRAGVVAGGEERIESITVATIQSLDDARLARVRDRFDVVIVDEAHHAAADSYRHVLSRLRARRWYGATATPKREDGLEAFTHHFLGPVVCQISHAELAAAGRSLVPSYEQERTSFRFAYGSREDWPRVLKALATDRARNAQIVDRVGADCNSGDLGAILTGTVEHAQALHEQIVQLWGLRAEVLTGRTPKRQRACVLDAARSGDLDAIVGTQLLDEGIDIPRLARVYLAWPSKAEGRLVQRIGRALRPHPGKAAPVVVDFVDLAVGVLANQARKRRAAFDRVWPSAARRAA